MLLERNFILTQVFSDLSNIFWGFFHFTLFLDSFDDSVDEDGGRSPMFVRNKHLDSFVNSNNHIPQSPTMNGDLSGFLSPRSNRRLMPSSKSTQPLLQLNSSSNGTTQNGTSNGHISMQNGRSPGPFPAAPPALHLSVGKFFSLLRIFKRKN